jgi:hypothetical protein
MSCEKGILTVESFQIYLNCNEDLVSLAPLMVDLNRQNGSQAPSAQ